ncbi:hypothetical protein SLEP1_g54873 [Rubroshorea leprosula]|uniref:Uncharacterized protein n=1 Tax=Rubroshorea leprosula TaxID=152421 RepID=A0AAV5MEG5_9ROSI|nr:hypothetical protein SLEP1_g54873 [Rubroshorea leprosula]
MGGRFCPPSSFPAGNGNNSNGSRWQQMVAHGFVAAAANRSSSNKEDGSGPAASQRQSRFIQATNH